MTPRDVKRRYSKGRVFDVVFRKGYRNSGTCALKGISLRKLAFLDRADH